MVAPFLALTYQAGTPQVKRYAGPEVSPVGTAFGTADITLPGTAGFCYPGGRVIRFGGLNTFLALTGSNIWRSTDAGTTWSSVGTLSLNATNTSRKSGFIISQLNGVPIVCFDYQNSAGNSWSGQYSIDGITWITQGPFPYADTLNPPNNTTGNSFNDIIAVGGNIYTAMHGANTLANLIFIMMWVPGANVGIDFMLSPTKLCSLCEFNNQIIILGSNTAETDSYLFTIIGQVFSTLVTLPNTSNDDGSSAAMFVDGAFLYTIYRGTGGGLICTQVSSTFTTADITSTVLPSSLTGASAVNTGSRVTTVIDGVTSPGASPTIYIYFSNTTLTFPAMPWAIYRWNGPSTQITLIGQGGSATDSLPTIKQVSGSYFVADSQFPSTLGISVEIVDRAFTTTLVVLSFKIYGTSSAGAVSFRIFVGNANAEYPTTAGTLTNPSNGSISGGTINIGLTADNGVTTYQVSWDAITDGFVQTDQYKLIGDVFI